MATLVLGLAGQALGNALLPAGVQLFGQTITGAAIGGAIGAYAGSQVDAMLRGSARVQGPRLSELHVQASTEGAPVPRVWGAARLAGQVIWATRFAESASTRGGGKGGSHVTEYSYSASFAVGLCEGVIGGIGRVWADGKDLALDGVTMRVHLGTENQMPDPLIAAVEGAENAPAYRGLAYVVFEDLALEPFGNRVPQLSFEVMRPVAEGGGGLAEIVEAVCLIPGSGEFALSTTKVLRDAGRGACVAENVNNRTGVSDIEASLDQLQAQLPNVKRVAIVVSWFGDDLRCGVCRIRPGVEIAEKRTHPLDWSVAGIGREDAYVVSATDGRPNYGGTPSDASVLEAIAALKSRGIEVMLYPFVLMDVPPENGLPDPYGGTEQAAFPWRGRVTCHPAAGVAGSVDRTGAAAGQVDAFFDGEWGLSRMVLHYAALAAEAGGVDAILIGSELRGVTTVRSSTSVYPAVAKMRALAADVRAIVGAGTAISYAADWTEWFGHQPADGTGDVHFHLDPLWADDDIDFIGIDSYAPLADWREGTGHLDFGLSQTGSMHDLDYLKAGIEGGEGYDWYYAGDAARVAQTRVAITDGAYAKPWVFRPKDIRNWWLNAHVDRPGGVEGAATAWVPQSKPIRFTEIGCPAVDKGANQPNVFFDPKSSESALPWFSSGARDDLMQARFIEALLGYWRDPALNPMSPVYGAAMIDVGRAHVWAWDSRPYPDWPLREHVWADGPLWRVGHWLNGRAGVAPLGEMVSEICARAGVSDVDVSGLRGGCAGYALDRVMSAREALSPLMDAFAFDAADSGGRLRFFHRGDGAAIAVDRLAEREDGAGAVVEVTRAETGALPMAVRVSYVDPLAEYRVASVEARLTAPRSAKLMQIDLPIAMGGQEAEGVAARVLHEAWTSGESASFAVPPSLIALEPGDVVTVEAGGRDWTGRITQLAEDGVRLVEAGRLERQIHRAVGARLEGALSDVPPVYGPAMVTALDIDAEGLMLAAFAEPWPGVVAVARREGAEGSYREAARLNRRAVTGETASVLRRGAPHRWDRGNHLDVLLYGGSLAAATEAQVLEGANRVAVETSAGVWEVIQFADAELIAPQTWRLSTLLRGQAGTERAIADALPAGARFILLDEAVRQVGIAPEETGEVHLRHGPAHLPVTDIAAVEETLDYAALARLPWTPCQIGARREASGDVTIGWIRRARDDAGRWAGLEVSLGEEREAYRVEVMDGSSVLRTIECDTPSLVYGLAAQTADWGGLAPSPLALRVAQVSPRFGAGFAAAATVNI
jgi:hypothetical protein